jgi:hypothetical protein
VQAKLEGLVRLLQLAKPAADNKTAIEEVIRNATGATERFLNDFRLANEGTSDS